MASGLRFGTLDNCICVGRDGSVGIGTRCRLDGPGIKSRWEVRFSALVETGPGAHPASGSLPGLKRPGRGVDHPPPSSAGLKKSVLFLCTFVTYSRVRVTFHSCVEIYQCSASVDETRTASLFRWVHTCNVTVYRNAVTLQETDTIRSYELNFHPVPHGVTVFCERYTLAFPVCYGSSRRW